MQKETTINLEERNGATLVVAGSEKEYRLPIRTLWAAATLLELRTSYNHTEPTLYIVGKCELLKKDTISIIGYDGLKSKELALSIHPVEQQDDLDYDSDDESRPKDATIGYSEHDWEIGNKSEFFLELYIPRRRVEHLSELIGAGKVERLVIGVRTEQLYVDDFHAPPSMWVTWYLRPEKTSGKVTNPELSQGRLRGLTITQRSVALGAIKAEGDEENDELELDSPTAVPTRADNGHANSEQVATLKAIAKTLRLMPWIIGISALIIALS